MDSCGFSVLLVQFMLVCGSGSLGAGVGADVGVGLSVSEHTAQYDAHLWTDHAPAAAWLFYFRAVCRFLRFFRFFHRCSPHGRISEHADALDRLSVAHAWARP